jgi:uncharacterized RDD family membrane protein YckC
VQFAGQLPHVAHVARNCVLFVAAECHGAAKTRRAAFPKQRRLDRPPRRRLASVSFWGDMVLDEVNPYAAPEGELDTGERPSRHEPLRLASLGQRWFGAAVDRVVLMGGAGLLGHTWLPLSSSDVYGIFPRPLFQLPVIAVALLQGALITLTGQSVGKRLARTRIVRASDGSHAGFVRGACAREWVPVLLLAILELPGSNLLGIVDILPIFGNDRRCLHDYLAGTIVVRAGGRA